MAAFVLIMIVTTAALGIKHAFGNVVLFCVFLLLVILGVAAVASPKRIRKVALGRVESCLFCIAISEFLLINIPVLFSPIWVVIPVFWMIILYCPSMLRWKSGLSDGWQIGIGDFLVVFVAVATASTLWVVLTKLWREWPVGHFPLL